MVVAGIASAVFLGTSTPGVSGALIGVFGGMFVALRS